MRAGRPRSRVGIFHPTNRDYGSHPAQEWGKGPFASLSITPPREGESTRAKPRPQPYFWLAEVER